MANATIINISLLPNSACLPNETKKLSSLGNINAVTIIPGEIINKIGHNRSSKIKKNIPPNPRNRIISNICEKIINNETIEMKKESIKGRFLIFSKKNLKGCTPVIKSFYMITL